MKRNSNHTIWLFMIGAVLFTGVIWSNSFQSVAVSSGQSQWFVDHLQSVLTAIGIDPSLWVHLVRKAAHLAEFFVVGVLWSAFWVHKTKKILPGSLNALGLCLITAVIDETIQLFIPGRGGMLQDVWIDLTGAVLAVLFTAAVTAAWWKMKRLSGV